MERTLTSELREDALPPSWLEAIGEEPMGSDSDAALFTEKKRHLALVKSFESSTNASLRDKAGAREPGSSSEGDEPAKSAERFDIAESMFTRGNATWPALRVPFDVFARFIATRPLSDRWLQLLPPARASDLFLVCATAHGDTAAIRAFDASYVRNLHRIVRAQCKYLRSYDEDELKQLVRQRLLIGNDHKPPRISEYSGAGTLRSWVGTIAIRMARNLARERREILVNDLEPEALGGVEDPEAELVGRECQLKVFHALRVARSRLGQHEWEVLRQRYDEELSAAKIGALHGVHRATVARWLESAYGVLEHEIRRYLAENHRTSQHEIDAMIERSMRRREWAHDPVLADAG